MNFIDTAKIKISSGKGGNGVVAWRREKYEPNGGPAGGDGGRGGTVYIEADENLGTLLDFKYRAIFKATDGEKGGNKNKTGKAGEDLLIKVPCGTIVKDASNGEIIADLVIHKQKILLAQGGRGGRGNQHFSTSSRQAPHYCEPGEPAIERELEFELKLIAEVGIIGVPSAGKSTLISVISAAKPKIAEYHFTTLVPNLGVVKKPNGDGFVIADIPGLIKGASEGAGLGHDFIRHVERTRLLVHVVDASGSNSFDPIEAYETIQEELKAYNKILAKKKQMLVLNKTDLMQEDELKEVVNRFKKKKLKPLLISAATKQNIDKLLNELFEFLEKNPKEEKVELQTYYDPESTDHKLDEYVVYRDNQMFYVEGKKIEGFVSVTKLNDYQSVGHLMRILKKIGVFTELAKHGAKEGDVVHLSGIQFEYSPDTMILT